jgi:hypothetical protein
VHSKRDGAGWGGGGGESASKIWSNKTASTATENNVRNALLFAVMDEGHLDSLFGDVGAASQIEGEQSLPTSSPVVLDNLSGLQVLNFREVCFYGAPLK